MRRVKEGTSAVLLQSGLNESCWADSMECCICLRNVTDLLSDGKTPYERRFGQPFNGPIISFGSLVEYHPITAFRAVFTEQRSSASQVTVVEIMDIISILPGCDGQVADAISAYTHVKMEDTHKLLKIPDRSVQTFGFVYHDTNGLNHCPIWKIQSSF